MLGETRIPLHFREQAKWCQELRSPFTAELLERFAADYDAGGPIANICEGWTTNPRKDALGLRITGALHHAVLSGKAPELAADYPAQNPDWQMDKIWPLAKDWLAANIPHVQTFIHRPPQTNETRRSIALLPGFLKLSASTRKPFRLLELGASAGLNQLWDHYTYDGGSWHRNGAGSVNISTDWQAPVPEHLDAEFTVDSRAACDLTPIDLSDPEARLRLISYTWPDQKERLDRLQSAIDLALSVNVHVEQADAAEWIERQLAEPVEDVLTIVYHSVFLIYPPRDQIARIMSAIQSAGERATEAAPLAWLCYESEALFGGDKTSPDMLTRLQTWPGADAEILLRSDGHVTKVRPA